MKRFTKKLIAFLGIFALLLLTFDLLSATERFRGVFAALTDSSDYEEGAEAFFSALETGLTPEEQKKDKSTMPGMSENPFDKVYLVTPAGGDDEMTARLTEKAKYHFDAEMCTCIAEAVELAHANTRRGLLVCGGEAAALEAAELLVNS